MPALLSRLYPRVLHAGLPFLILAAFLILSSGTNLSLYVPELVGYAALLTILLAFVLFIQEKTDTSWSPGFILVLAAILRVLFLFQPPQLSDDIFRYLFDGFMLLGGNNPYAEAPAAVTPPNPATAALIPQVNHAHLPTIYPPAAQIIFAAGAFFGGIFGMKLILGVMDLTSCSIILQLLKKLNLPTGRATLYAWHPLPIIEISASGHVDAAAICFLMLALLATLYGSLITGQAKGYGNRRRRGWNGVSVALAGGACFAAAVLVKWIPLLFLPGFFLFVRRPMRIYWVAGCGIMGVLLMALFWPDIKNSFTTLSVYLSNWEFSGFGFRTLRRITGSGQTARIILAACGLVALGLCHVKLLIQNGFSGQAAFPNLADRHPDALMVLQYFYTVAMIWLFLTPTLHPWYALYLVCFLPFAAGPAGLALSWSVFLAYQVRIHYYLTGQWTEDEIRPLLIVAAPVLAWIGHRGIVWIMRHVIGTYKSGVRTH